jgi:hypothetical protein
MRSDEWDEVIGIVSELFLFYGAALLAVSVPAAIVAGLLLLMATVF